MSHILSDVPASMCDSFDASPTRAQILRRNHHGIHDFPTSPQIAGPTALAAAAAGFNNRTLIQDWDVESVAIRIDGFYVVVIVICI
jgi:hypothetical protein